MIDVSRWSVDNMAFSKSVKENWYCVFTVSKMYLFA